MPDEVDVEFPDNRRRGEDSYLCTHFPRQLAMYRDATKECLARTTSKLRSVLCCGKSAQNLGAIWESFHTHQVKQGNIGPANTPVVTEYRQKRLEPGGQDRLPGSASGRVCLRYCGLTAQASSQLFKDDPAKHYFLYLTAISYSHSEFTNKSLLEARNRSYQKITVFLLIQISITKVYKFLIPEAPAYRPVVEYIQAQNYHAEYPFPAWGS